MNIKFFFSESVWLNLGQFIQWVRPSKYVINIARCLLLNGSVRGQTAVHKAHRGRTKSAEGRSWVLVSAHTSDCTQGLKTSRVGVYLVNDGRGLG